MTASIIVCGLRLARELGFSFQIIKAQTCSDRIFLLNRDLALPFLNLLACLAYVCHVYICAYNLLVIKA